MIYSLSLTTFLSLSLSASLSLSLAAEKGYVSVDEFPAHVANMHANDDYLFSVEYPVRQTVHCLTEGLHGES